MRGMHFTPLPACPLPPLRRGSGRPTSSCPDATAHTHRRHPFAFFFCFFFFFFHLASSSSRCCFWAVFSFSSFSALAFSLSLSRALTFISFLARAYLSASCRPSGHQF